MLACFHCVEKWVREKMALMICDISSEYCRGRFFRDSVVILSGLRVFLFESDFIIDWISSTVVV